MNGEPTIQKISRLAAMQLTICGIADLAQFRDANVSHMVSILDPDSIEPACLDTFPAHARLDLRFHDIVDEQSGMVCPNRRDIHRLLEFGRVIESRPGAHLLVHCHAGISRSTAAMTLLLAHGFADSTAEQAIERTLEIKPNSWPNFRMIEIGDEALGRGGNLVAAVRRHYADMIRRYPALGTVLGCGRALRGGVA